MTLQALHADDLIAHFQAIHYALPFNYISDYAVTAI
jgi:hypothetical protein